MPAPLNWVFLNLHCLLKAKFLVSLSVGSVLGTHQHQWAQNINPGARAVVSAPHPHNTKTWFLLHRPAHMLINPCSASLNQKCLQGGSMLAQKLFTSATTQHTKTCMQQKRNLTGKGQSSIKRRADKESGDNPHWPFSRQKPVLSQFEVTILNQTCQTAVSCLSRSITTTHKLYTEESRWASIEV